MAALLTALRHDVTAGDALRWHLLLLVLLSSLCSTGWAEQMAEGMHRAFLHSSDLATHCALEGQAGNHTVTLHVFMRLAPGPTENTLKAAGFAVLRGPNTDDSYHLTQSELVHQLSARMFLRSPYTSAQYVLEVKRPANDSQGYRVPHLVQVTALWGNWTLQNGDKPQQDYELRVEGFKWYCTVMAAPSPILQAPSNSWPPRQDTAVAHSSLGPGTKVWVLLTSFHESDPAAFATLLRHHFSWHRLMGVHGYLLYVQGSLDRLLSDPTIQSFISQGRLIVVLFDDMGRHEHTPLQPVVVDRYILQVQIENHGVLALWNSDSLMVSVDPDEFLMTPQPLTVTEMFRAVANGGPAPAAVVMRRSGMVCGTNAPVDCCGAWEPIISKWLALSPADVEAGRKQHPISCLALSTSHDAPDFAHEKVIVDPNLTRGIFTHWVSTTLPATKVSSVNEDIVRLAHIVNLYNMRHRPGQPLAQMRGPSQNWLWPVDQLLSTSNSSKGTQ